MRGICQILERASTLRFFLEEYKIGKGPTTMIFTILGINAPKKQTANGADRQSTQSRLKTRSMSFLRVQGGNEQKGFTMFLWL